MWYVMAKMNSQATDRVMPEWCWTVIGEGCALYETVCEELRGLQLKYPDMECGMVFLPA